MGTVGVAELVYATHLKCVARKGLRVRVPPPTFNKKDTTMSLEQEILTVEFHKDTHIDLILTETIRFFGYNVPEYDNEWIGVRENSGIIVEVPHLQIEFWKGNKLQVRVIENDKDDDHMTVDIVGVPDYQEDGFVGQLALINKTTMKIVELHCG